MTTLRTTDTEDTKAASRSAGRKVLIIFLGFFVVFASVDAFFVYKALSTYSGEVTTNAYEKGLKFNDIIAEAKRRSDDRQSAQ